MGSKEVDWNWFRGKGWIWLHSHPDWKWFKDTMWGEIRIGDRNFLDQFGFSDLFNEYNVEYVNITEEPWIGRTTDPYAIKRHVESQFSPVHSKKLYGMVPEHKKISGRYYASVCPQIR